MNLIVNTVVGVCLRKHRLAHNITQRKLARLMCRRQSFISLIENGQRNIKAADLLQYVLVLGDNPDEIINEIRNGLINIGYLPEP